MLQTLLVLIYGANTLRTSASKYMHKGSRLVQHSQADASSEVRLIMVALYFWNSRSNWMAILAFVDGSTSTEPLLLLEGAAMV